MNRTIPEGIPADPFSAIITTGQLLLPPTVGKRTQYQLLREAESASIGAVDINALGMFALTLARDTDVGGREIGLLAQWAIPYDGEIPGQVAAVGIRRVKDVLCDDTFSTSITLHGAPIDSAHHTGLLVFMEGNADESTPSDTSVYILGAPTTPPASGQLQGINHIPENALHIGSHLLNDFRANGPEGLGTYAGVLPLIQECSRILTRIAFNPSAVK